MDFRPGGFRIRLLTHLPLPHPKLDFLLVTQAHTGPRKVPDQVGTSPDLGRPPSVARTLHPTHPGRADSEHLLK